MVRFDFVLLVLNQVGMLSLLMIMIIRRLWLTDKLAKRDACCEIDIGVKSVLRSCVM